MSYSYNPNKYTKYDNTKTFEENKAAGAVLELEKMNGLEEAVKKNSASLEIGSVTVVTTAEEAKAEVEFDEVNGVKKINLSIPQGPQGEQGPTGPQGEQGPQGKTGAKGAAGKDGIDGKTPVKGEDYYTQEEKAAMVAEIVDEVKLPNTPYYDEELNKFFACGVHVRIEAADETGMLKAVWADNKGGYSSSLVFPEMSQIYGGGNGLEKPVYYTTTMVTLNSGAVDLVSGGGFGECSVGHATVIVNGGEFRNSGYVTGGGHDHKGNNYQTNHVGESLVIINNSTDKIETVYGAGCSGLVTVGKATVIINGGSVKYAIAGGSNGYTGMGEIIVNGGEIDIIQGVNRGHIDNISITVNNGLVKKLYAGGETDDKSVNGTIGKANLKLLGGTISSVEIGTDGDVIANPAKISCECVKGLISGGLGDIIFTEIYDVQAALKQLLGE